MAFPDGLKFRFFYDAGVEFLAPDMGVQFLHGGDGRDFNGSIVKVGYVVGVTVHKDVNGAESQPLISTVEELNAHIWGEEFHACVIEKAEFEAIWESHTYNGALKESGGF